MLPLHFPVSGNFSLTFFLLSGLLRKYTPNYNPKYNLQTMTLPAKITIMNTRRYHGERTVSEQDGKHLTGR
jgi:hypothetical protein